MKVGKWRRHVVKHDAIVRGISVRRLEMMNEIKLERGERSLDMTHQFY